MWPCSSFAAGVILIVAEPFAESLVELGEAYDIPEFLLVKWLAPLASESPELLVAALFAWKLSARTGFGALLSSKVNQWTLLVGTLPVVFAISSGSFNGLPLGVEQRDELLVTAAQSMFAVAILASRSMDRREAWVLFGLVHRPAVRVVLCLDRPAGRLQPGRSNWCSGGVPAGGGLGALSPSGRAPPYRPAKG